MENKQSNPYGIPFFGLVVIDLVFVGVSLGSMTISGIKWMFLIDAIIFGCIAYISYKHYVVKSEPINLIIVKWTPLNMLVSNIVYTIYCLFMVFVFS